MSDDIRREIRRLKGYSLMYEAWTSDDYPRFIAVTLQQATPWFPDSYSVNSVNQGPYGDAVINEMIPLLERQFRMIAKPYARHVEGASASGWQTLALLLRNPDFFGGGWVLQPDPIDFERYQLVNIYSDTNAFRIPRDPFNTTERYFQRTVEGQPLVTVREMTAWEAVLGTKGRAGGQLSAWEAIYGPIGRDGYSVPLWDARTGTIDRDVANYMRDNGYDLLAYAKKNWGTLGPKLQGWRTDPIAPLASSSTGPVFGESSAQAAGPRGGVACIRIECHFLSCPRYTFGSAPGDNGPRTPAGPSFRHDGYSAPRRIRFDGGGCRSAGRRGDRG